METVKATMQEFQLLGFPKLFDFLTEAWLRDFQNVFLMFILYLPFPSEAGLACWGSQIVFTKDIRMVAFCSLRINLELVK